MVEAAELGMEAGHDAVERLTDGVEVRAHLEEAVNEEWKWAGKIN